MGSGTTISFSFPWASNLSASFAGYNGSAYSPLGENLATYHYGLTATQMVAARGALQAWGNVANISFVEVADTATNVGDIRFGWTSANKTNSTGNQAWGWAGYPNAYWPSGGDVWISTQTSSATASWAVGSDNYNALLHEIGHAIGLKHTFDGNPTLPLSLDTRQFSVMSYTVAAHSLFVQVVHNANGSVSCQSYYVEPETPMVLDIEAIQYMYGPNLGYRTGDDLYTFDTTTPFMKTIWDAGGNDTISVANFSRACTIDLRPGHYSSIAIPSDSTAGYNWFTQPPTPTYDGTDNLGIAYGVTIENAVGGAGNDVLRGNDVVNHLDGGAGNDVLYGGAGDDFFDWDPAQRGGTDMFYGGTGNDRFVLTLGDQVVEYDGEGTDVVYVSFSYALGDNLEILVGMGLAGLVLTGNSLDNLIQGGAGDDTIIGGAGSDTAVYDSPSSGYVITQSGAIFIISSSASGIDVLFGVEFAQFSDARVALIDTLAPTVATFSPADEASSVQIGSDVVVTFSEAIQRGTGSIVLKTAAGGVVATYDAATSANLSLLDRTLTINPTGDLDYSTSYKVEFAAGTIKDSAGNSFAGTASYNFTTIAAPDLTAPTTMTFSPADEATSVSVGENIVLTFSEAIQRGTGSIVLKTAAGAVVATYDAATSANLSISGSTLTINPTADLGYSTGYQVEFAAGTIKDLAGNNYAGSADYNFATRPAGASLLGGPESDVFVSTRGDDRFDGGSGIDTVFFRGLASQYSIVQHSGTWAISGPDGVDELVNVERLKIGSDQIAIDIGGNAGMAYRLYKAAFNRLPDLGGLGYQMHDLDLGVSLSQVASNFIASPEFQSTYGAVSDSQFVTLLYSNVLDRKPDADGLQYHVNRLADGVSRADILIGFSESPENKLNVIGLIEHGMPYIW